jgi:hypothetical protein
MGAATTQQENAERAVAAYNALLHYFSTDHGLLNEAYPPGFRNRYAHHWPFVRALAATLDMAGTPDIGDRYAGDAPDRLQALALYWDGGASPPGYDSAVRPPRGPGGDKFYDDNEWAGLALVQLARQTGDAGALRQAAEIFDFVLSGWDNDPSHPAPGGVYWAQAAWSRDRNTVSNAPGAELGLHLHELTGEARYLEWARRMYDWTDRHLRAPNGLYWDHVDLGGAVETTQWSYNQGTMIGAGALLSRVTDDAAHLERAARTADAALAHYARVDYFTQDPAFNAIFFRNLLLLHADRPDPAYRRAMQGYADRAWDTVRDVKTTLFRFKPTRSVALLDQAAMVQIYACLAWDHADYRRLA